jgi:phage terminase large subunit
MESIQIPYQYLPRKYQMPVWEAYEDMVRNYEGGVKRFCLVWHRRAGKDKSVFNIMVTDAMTNKGTYYYFFPTYSQGKKILWDGIDPRTGLKFLDHAPKEILEKKHEAEMKLTLTSGSIIQLIGTDNYDSIVGTNPRGCVFSEYSLQDPMAWKYIQPILAENKGWAIFVYTPRGRNHAWELYNMARLSPDWFTQVLTVRDTERIDGSPVISLEEIEKQRAEGMGDELIEQEYFCSFEGFVQGAYYVKQLREARKDGRICSVPHAAGHEVYTFWDLGIDDSTTIWFLQVVGREFRFIDFYEASGEGLEHYAKVLKEKRYTYGDHYMPHDAANRELGTGKSRQEVAEALGIYPITIVKRPRDTQAIMAGIEQGRNILSQCWFDERKCQRGLMALEGYQCEYDEEKKKMGNHPVHNWCSHGADAFRTFAIGYVAKMKPRTVSQMMDSMNIVSAWG